MKKQFPIFVLIIIIANSCCSDDEYCFVDRDQIKQYNIGDKYIYLNDSGNDTLIITNYYESLEGEDDKGSFICHDVYYREYTSYSLTVNNENYSTIGYNCINQGEPSIFIFGSMLSPKRKMAFIQIDGIIYIDVTQYTPSDFNQGEMTSLWYNRKFGIIKYKKTGNRTFILER